MARRVQPLALQSQAEPCCGLILGCHTLRCDPSVSVTLPALQRGKGNRCEGGLTPEWEKESAAVSVLSNYLWFSVSVAPHYKKKKKGISSGVGPPLCRVPAVGGAYREKKRLRSRRPIDEFDVLIAVLGFKPPQLMRGFCLYCHIISWDVMS